MRFTAFLDVREKRFPLSSLKDLSLIYFAPKWGYMEALVGKMVFEAQEYILSSIFIKDKPIILQSVEQSFFN